MAFCLTSIMTVCLFWIFFFLWPTIACFPWYDDERICTGLTYSCTITINIVIIVFIGYVTAIWDMCDHNADTIYICFYRDCVVMLWIEFVHTASFILNCASFAVHVVCCNTCATTNIASPSSQGHFKRRNETLAMWSVNECFMFFGQTHCIEAASIRTHNQLSEFFSFLIAYSHLKSKDKMCEQVIPILCFTLRVCPKSVLRNECRYRRPHNRMPKYNNFIFFPTLNYTDASSVLLCVNLFADERSARKLGHRIFAHLSLELRQRAKCDHSAVFLV